MAVLGGKIGEGVVWCLPQRTCSYFWGLLPLCHFSRKSIKKYDRESAHRQTDRHTHTQTETNWIYNLSHAVWYRYGAGNKLEIIDVGTVAGCRTFRWYSCCLALQWVSLQLCCSCLALHQLVWHVKTSVKGQNVCVVVSAVPSWWVIVIVVVVVVVVSSLSCCICTKLCVTLSALPAVKPHHFWG